MMIYLNNILYLDTIYVFDRENYRILKGTVVFKYYTKGRPEIDVIGIVFRDRKTCKQYLAYECYETRKDAYKAIETQLKQYRKILKRYEEKKIYNYQYKTLESTISNLTKLVKDNHEED